MYRPSASTVVIVLALAACSRTDVVQRNTSATPSVTDTGGGSADPSWAASTTPDPAYSVAVQSEMPVDVSVIDAGPGPVGPYTEEMGVDPMESHTIAVSVRAGENLVFFAQWADISVDDIIDSNDIDPLATLQPGDEVAIPVADAEGAVAFDQAREVFAADRLDRYLTGRGGLLGVTPYAVHTGETAWEIARDQAGIPTWVLSEFNRGVDLNRLRIGERLQLPVLGDTVAVEELAPMSGELDLGVDVGGGGAF